MTFSPVGPTANHFPPTPWPFRSPGLRVDVKGNDVLVADNAGRNTTNDGYRTHTQQYGWGCGTVFRNNRSTLTVRAVRRRWPST